MYSDDQLRTYSSIEIPRDVSVYCSDHGDEVELGFGVHGRVTLNIDAAMVAPIVTALTQARTTEDTQ